MELAHVRRGSGPPLLVVQQLDPPEFWGPAIDLLARQREVTALVLPGFGDSPPLPDGRTPTVTALAEAAAAWLHDAGHAPAPVVGNSLGGAVAIELARRGAVTGAVAISPIGFWTRREAATALRSLRVGGAIARATRSRPRFLTATAPGRTMAFGQIVARPREMPVEAARAGLHGMATAPGFDATRRAALDYRVEGPEPDVPVTIAWAEKDRLTRPRQAERVRDVLPSARLVMLEGCGHAAMVDDPDQVARVVLEATGD